MRPERTSLSLDLIEELRAVLADRFVLSLINKKIVTEKDFVTKENGTVLMNDDLRKKLLTEWQNKKKEPLIHPYLKERVEWGGSLCAGNAIGEIFKRRFRQLSSISLEMRRKKIR